MATVMVELSMSLDGFISAPNPSREYILGTGKGELLHDWYFSGTTPSPHNPFFKAGEGSEKIVEEMFTETGAIVVGRKWYDLVGGWDGNHPIRGAEIFVVMHHVPEQVPQGETKLTFVTDGVESAIWQAKAAAGSKMVVIESRSVGNQCLKLGLVDEVMVHLVPILLGDGVRRFEPFGTAQTELEIAEVIPAKGVTHLRYRVLK